MRAVTKPLDEQARSIFSDLGYTVTEDGTGFLAERKWRVVHVTTAENEDEPPESGEYRCFVAWDDEATALERRLRRRDPAYEWAVIGVDESGDYEVTRAPDAA
ncbi:MAG: hypothetical protein ABEJ40_06280 [Haloarculaceae archaeon]